MLKYRFRNVLAVLCLTVSLVSFGSCSQADDVVSIFTGKTWKLSLVTEDDKNEFLNIWSSVSEKEKDLKSLRSNRDAYTVSMSGILEGDVISGEIEITTLEGSSRGYWQANSKDRSFKVRIVGEPTTALEREFVMGLNNAFSYDGSDENNLYVRYNKDGRVCRLSFRVLR